MLTEFYQLLQLGIVIAGRFWALDLRLETKQFIRRKSDRRHVNYCTISPNPIPSHERLRALQS